MYVIIGSVSHVTRYYPEIAICHPMLLHTNAERSKNGAPKRCIFASNSSYVLSFIYVVRVYHFRVHNLQKSRDTLADPIAIFAL